MQVLKYEAHNVLGIKDVRFDLAGRHLFLVGGRNGQGKSSALTALVMALAGKSGMTDYPEIALRKGQKRGKVVIKLSGDEELMESDCITVELSLRHKPSGAIVEEFRVLDSTGEEAPEPRKLLQRLFTLRAFDPLAFERMKPKEKATLVQELLGLDLGKFDTEYKRVYDERTNVGRDGKKLAAQLEGMSKHKDVPTAEIKISELLAELDDLQAKDKAKKGKIEQANRCKESLERLRSSEEAIEQEIKELQDKLERTRVLIKETELQEAKIQQEILEMPDMTTDIASVKQRIADADQINKKIRENEKYLELEQELKKSRKEWQDLTDRLKDIQDKRAEAVANAKWPIEGMELNEDGLLMNGLPFEQASTSQRIMASVKVGMALNPKLRLLVCQHGSDLDNDTLSVLEQAAKENDFQLLIETVTRTEADEERCAVIIEDGRVVGAEELDVDDTDDFES
jgi:DNA repair exonuclease SbcCD ATPase subunit